MKLTFFRLTDEQRAIIQEFALLERNTPGTIEGLGDIQREKAERNTEPQNFGREKTREKSSEPEEKSVEKPGLLTRIKKAIFG